MLCCPIMEDQHEIEPLIGSEPDIRYRTGEGGRRKERTRGVDKLNVHLQVFGIRETKRPSRGLYSGESRDCPWEADHYPQLPDSE